MMSVLRSLGAALLAVLAAWFMAYMAACDITGGVRCFPFFSPMATCRADAAAALKNSGAAP